MNEHPHFDNLRGVVFLSGGQVMTHEWSCDSVFQSGKPTVVAVLPAAFTPV